MHGSTDAGSAIESLHDARIALRSAWYDTALQLLDGCEDWSAPHAERGVLLKAETLGRRDPVAAQAYLASVDDLFLTVEGRFGRNLESGRSHAAVRDFDRAAARYASARQLAHDVPNGAATVAYHDLRMRWFRRDCDPSAPEIALALTHPDRSVVAATYAYRGWLHAGRGDYPAQMADFRTALAVEPAGDEPIDVATLAFTTHALARVAFETADEEGIRAATVAADLLAWTPDVDVSRFETLRALGWDAFMRGESGRAQWTFKDARAIAPSAAWRTMAHCDRAYVARIVRNDAWAIEELAEADRLAREVRWEATYGEERQALIVLAQLYAEFDAGRAQHYASTYARLGVENVNPAFAVAGDRRTVAAALYAQGVIDATLGRIDDAIPSFTDAYEIWSGAKHHFRATLCAAALAEATGAEPWRKIARQHARRYPDCPLAEIADDAAGRDDAMPRDLTPLQRQIARALWAGATPPELSRRFSRSVYTIEQQIVGVLAAFGVASRSELLHEARARGLT
ncbi:MAG: hypothetical protein NVS3B7_05200 [Candidatus Elarobacter sp.]